MKYTSRLSLLLACIVWLNPLGASAAPPNDAPEDTGEPPAYRSLMEYNTARKTRDVNVMWALGGWATANVISGAIGWPLETDKRWKAFHGMNVAWGAINLAIAIGVGIKIDIGHQLITGTGWFRQTIFSGITATFRAARIFCR